MRQSTDDDLETRLRELFEHQAVGIGGNGHAWHDAPMVADELEPRRRPRARAAAIAAVAVAASVLLVIGIVATAPARDALTVGGQPGSSVPLHFATEQVRFDASALKIAANGRTFTAAGSQVDVNSDPGYATYQTLELGWHEHGVAMRLYFYFAADAHDWWVSSLTTYNGHAEPDSIEYRGPFFRTPLGSAYTGDVDLVPAEAPGAHLRIANMRLQPFLPPPLCNTQTGAYAIESNDGAQISLDAPGSVFDDTVTLYDRARCRPVSTPGRFIYQFTSSTRGVVSVQGEGCDPSGLPAGYCDTHTYVSLMAQGPGRATMHVEAIDVRTLAVVARLDVPVTAKR